MYSVYSVWSTDALSHTEYLRHIALGVVSDIRHGVGYGDHNSIRRQSLE